MLAPDEIDREAAAARSSGGWHPGVRSSGSRNGQFVHDRIGDDEPRPAPAWASSAGHACTCDSYITPPDCTPIERPVPIAM